jgi:hypothetical protein
VLVGCFYGGRLVGCFYGGRLAGGLDKSLGFERFVENVIDVGGGDVFAEKKREDALKKKSLLDHHAVNALC